MIRNMVILCLAVLDVKLGAPSKMTHYRNPPCSAVRTGYKEGYAHRLSEVLQTSAARIDRFDRLQVITMPFTKITVPLIFAALLSIAGFRASAAEPASPAIDFSRQIRPILSENCFACHGPDEKKRQRDLRLDVKGGALGKLRDGGFAIVPSKPHESKLVARITESDTAKRMPPLASQKTLTPAQIDLLQQWIAQGAKWSEHWSF